MRVKTFVLGGGGDWDRQMEQVSEFLGSSAMPGDRVRVHHVVQSSTAVNVPDASGCLVETVVTHLTILYEGLA